MDSSQLFQKDEVVDHFKVERLIGYGRFGEVYEVVNTKSETKHAMKVSTNTEPTYFIMATLEAMRLRDLSKIDTENRIVKYITHMILDQRVCLVMELEPNTLEAHLIEFHSQGMQPRLMKSLVKGLCSGLAFLKQNSILHGDIKPDNILVRSSDGNYLIGDFGRACEVPEGSQQVHTDIQSLLYRAPEVTLGYRSGCAIDVWSAGWVLVQALIGVDNFTGITDEQTKLQKLVSSFGMPPKHLLDDGLHTDKFFKKAGTSHHFLVQEGHTAETLKKSILNAVHNQIQQKNSYPEDLVEALILYDFLKEMLEWDPEKRLNPKDAPSRKYLAAGRYRMMMPKWVKNFRQIFKSKRL